ncbi:protein ALP1-like [Camponotus floridanus]|uniref:protein ALP1-like n=1 Tax=Camponotus floridanus TaxID=104421 RepID=UPI00059E81B6|nr:protein ALP1-like [Camponotus floridanus]
MWCKAPCPCPAGVLPGGSFQRSSAGHVSRQPLSVKKQVAIALYKLVSCAEYRVVGDVMGVHKSTVRKCLCRVTITINNVMVQDNIFMPSENEAQFISLQFKKRSFIPQLIWCIDGTHIPITAPHEGYRDFVNRKGWTSYNIMTVVDHNGRFRNVVIKYPGSTMLPYSRIVAYTRMHRPLFLRHLKTSMVWIYMIVGDSAYPILPWFIKGYLGTLSSEEEILLMYI